MKMNKSILTGMTALSLFATSAAAATSAVTPVVSNAAAKKTTKKSAVKHTYKFNWLNKVQSKGHATRYYNTVEKFHVTSKQMKKGWYWRADAMYGYSQKNRITKYRLKENRIIRVTKGVDTYTNTKHKAIKDSDFLGQGTYRISKAEFNKLNKQQTR